MTEGGFARVRINRSHGKAVPGRGAMTGELQLIRRSDVVRVSDHPPTLWADRSSAVKAAAARDGESRSSDSSTGKRTKAQLLESSRTTVANIRAGLTKVINWSGDPGDGVYIGGGDPKDINHTPFKTMEKNSISSSRNPLQTFRNNSKNQSQTVKVFANYLAEEFPKNYKKS